MGLRGIWRYAKFIYRVTASRNDPHFRPRPASTSIAMIPAVARIYRKLHQHAVTVGRPKRALRLLSWNTMRVLSPANFRRAVPCTFCICAEHRQLFATRKHTAPPDASNIHPFPAISIPALVFYTSISVIDANDFRAARPRHKI